MSPAASGQTTPNHSKGSPLETDPAKGRDFREISVHSNGKELLFVECSRELEPTGGCYVLRYHLIRKVLQRYALPEGHFYAAANFSPKGTYVVMNRVPKHDGSEEQMRQAHEQAEIVVMRADGTALQVLPLEKGNKVGPIMSLDETRVAYWRSTLRPPGSKTFSSKFDIWEVNRLTGQESLFAGQFKFFDRSGLQYLSQDEMLVGADGPSQYAQAISKYWAKYNRSTVYRIAGGMRTLPEPMLTEVEGAQSPSSDRAGNLYFQGQRPGISLFRKDRHGEIQQWEWPVRYGPGDWGGGGWYDLVADPGGSFIAFVYEIKGTLARDAKRKLGLLMTQTSEWRDLNIPSLQSSSPIVVKTAD